MRIPLRSIRIAVLVSVTLAAIVASTGAWTLGVALMLYDYSLTGGIILFIIGIIGSLETFTMLDEKIREHNNSRNR